ncbi:MAG: O-antigen ligase family protein, partial [Deltaproteobacteria bacterium]|nr:O-antigen ligase family protein [Deltaproteobacteria bacterium]
AACIAIFSWIDLRIYKFSWLEGNFLPFIGHVSYFGCVMALHLPLAVYLCARAKSPAVRMGWAAAGLCIGLGIWMAGSRASLLAVGGAGLLIAVLCVRAGHGRQVFVAASFCLAAIIIGGTVNPPMARKIATLDRFAMLVAHPTAEALDAMSSGRVSRYRNTLAMIADRPWIGWGIGRFRYVYPEYSQHTRPDDTFPEHAWFMHPHNECLHQAAEVGLVGLGIVLAMWGIVGWRLLRSWQIMAGDPRRPLTLLALAGLTIAWCDWQFSTTFTTPTVRLIVAWYGGLAWWGIAPVLRPYLRVGTRRMAAILTGAAVLAGLLCVGYAAGLFVQSAVWAGRPWALRHDGLRLSRWLAPATFESRYLEVAAALHRGGAPGGLRAAIDRLYEHYPDVPSVLYLRAQAMVRLGNLPEAKGLLAHALRNCPTFGGASELLTKIEKNE